LAVGVADAHAEGVAMARGRPQIDGDALAAVKLELQIPAAEPHLAAKVTKMTIGHSLQGPEDLGAGGDGDLHEAQDLDPEDRR
jgi:hypothetical protein